MSSPAIDQLRRRIARLEGTDPSPGSTLPLAIAAIDRMLPGGGLALGSVHEIAAADAHAHHDGAALGFSAALLGRLSQVLRRPVLWLAESTLPHAPGLLAFGLSPARLILVRPGNSAALLWTLEEAARSRALAGVLAEVRGLDFTAARRLHLAARASGVTLLLFNRAAPVGTAYSRWRVSGLPGADDRWRLELMRCRGRAADDSGLVCCWEVEWHGPTGGLHLAAAAADRSAVPGQSRVA